MNLYKYILIAYNKIVFLVLSMFTTDFPPKEGYEHNININKSKLNLISFTLKTFNYADLKSLLLNFNNTKIISVSHFLDCTPPNSISIFNSEGKLFASYSFHLHNPDNIEADLGFDRFVLILMNDVIKRCVYESMKSSVSYGAANNCKFYLNIGNKSIK